MDHDRYTALDFTDNPSATQVDRRDFLKIAGGGLVIFFSVGDPSALAQEGRGPQQGLPRDFNAYLKIGEDGRVSCFTGKIEMGQGPITSLPQMLADELDVSPDTVDMVMGDTDLCPWDRGTFGSMTTRFFGPALRAAGAEARRVLIDLASERLRVPPEGLATENGAVFDRTNPRDRVSYGRLAGGAKIARHLSGDAVTKKPAEFRVIGRPALRRDAREKVTGRAKYAGDIRLPAMLYAKILRPPAHGARLLDVDLSEARRMKDVLVVREGDFVAVLHRVPDVAEIALSRIKAQFDQPRSGLHDGNIFEHLLRVAPEGKVVVQGGDLRKGEAESAGLVEGTYLDGYVAHAPTEPHAALVTVEDGRATVWASSQAPFGVRQEVARELGLQPEQVHVISPFVGGGFGGKTRNLQAVEAARCARLTGRPVQVAWTRKEEFFFDSFRPAAVVKIKSGVTGKGSLCLWDYHVYFAGARGARQFYSIPNHSTTSHGSGWTGPQGSHPFATGAWRAPSNNTNTFAREAQIDLMAAKAEMDPVEFRMRNLTDGKVIRVLEAAALKFGWKPGRGPSGRGWGVACGIDAGTVVATMAEVDVDRGSGNVKVRRVVCAQDMGLVINPEGATIQMEGCITMGLGYALRKHVRFKNGAILDANFDTYEIPRFSWLPRIETVIVDNNEADAQGGGEPAIITMGAVIANAIYDAIGVRLYQLPLTPERVTEGMRKG